MTRNLLVLNSLFIFTASITAQSNFEFEGTQRSYYMEAPDPIPEGAPLVFCLHGYSSSSELIRAYSGWGDLAMEEGFVAIFPQGTEDTFGNAHWNANLGISETNDHGFLVALAQHLQETYNLSADCTYSCGMSNGGFMSYSLACEHPEVFKAIGSVTGSMSAQDFGCTPTEVVPIIHLHGTDDATVSYESGTGGSWGMEGVPSIIEHWTGLMGTTTVEELALPNQEAIDLTSVDFLRYAGSPGGQEFHHYRVNGGGHAWFGVWGSQDVESTQVMWDFFSAQCAGAFTSVAEEMPRASWLTLRGRAILADRPCTVRILDAMGRLVAQRPMRVGDLWTPDLSGFMLIHATDLSGQKVLLKSY